MPNNTDQAVVPPLTDDLLDELQREVWESTTATDADDLTHRLSAVITVLRRQREVAAPVAHAFVVDGECEQIDWGTDIELPDDPALVLLYDLSPAPATATQNAAIAAAVHRAIWRWASGDDPEMLMREIAAVMVGGGGGPIAALGQQSGPLVLSAAQIIKTLDWWIDIARPSRSHDAESYAAAIPVIREVFCAEEWMRKADVPGSIWG